MYNKMLKNKELYWTFLYQLTTLAGGLFLLKILAVTLSKEDYGYYSLITSIVALIVMLPFSALMQGIGRYISIYQQKDQYKQFFTTVILIHVVLIVVYFVLSYIFKSVYLENSTWEGIFYFVVVFSASEIIKILFRTINNANRQRKNLFFSTFVEFSLKIGLLALLHFYMSINIDTLLMVLIVGNIFSIFVMLYENRDVYFYKGLSTKQFKIFTLRIWIFASPLVIWAIFGWLRDMSNRWYLDYFLDKEQVALFAMMGSIAMIAPTALQGLIGSFYIPILYQKENSHKGYVRNFLYKMLPIVCAIFLFSFGVTYIFKDEIVLMIADAKYIEIAWMLPWMFLVFCIYALSMMATYEIFAHKQTKLLLWSSIVPGVVSIVGGYFFIKYYGINGALYNYIVTYGSYSVLTFYVVFKYIGKNRYKDVKVER